MSELKMDSPKVHLDEVLEKLGAFGKHQMVTMCMLALVYATNSMYNVNYVFAVEDVNYRCKIPQCDVPSPSFTVPWLNHSSPPLGEEAIKQCQHFRVSEGCNFNRSVVDECSEWVYEVPNSFVAEFGLACEDWKQALVGTVHLFGNMLGLLVQGQISDRFGRKTAAVFAGTMGAVLGIAKSFASSYWCYVALEALEAAVGDALSPMFMLSIEIVEKKRAVFFQMILLNCYTCGLIVMPFVAWALPYWRHFLRAIYAPTLLVLAYSFFLDESIRWLYSKGKRDRAAKLIQKIATRNGVEIDKAMLNKLDYIGEDKTNVVNDRKLLIKTFKSKIMMQRFLICLVWWFTITLINYGMMISSVFIDGNKYINFALLMLMDIPSNIFYWLALSKYKRKIPLLTSFVVGGIFCISQPFVPKGYAWLGLALFMAFETLATFSYNIVYMYTSELFPTYTRNSAHALCGAAGRAGALLAPQTPLLISYWSGLPALLFGLTSLLSGALTLFVPETANTELPDTVLEAEMIGRRPSPKAVKTQHPDTGQEREKEHLLLENGEMIGRQSNPKAVKTQHPDTGQEREKEHLLLENGEMIGRQPNPKAVKTQHPDTGQEREKEHLLLENGEMIGRQTNPKAVKTQHPDTGQEREKEHLLLENGEMIGRQTNPKAVKTQHPDTGQEREKEHPLLENGEKTWQ